MTIAARRAAAAAARAVYGTGSREHVAALAELQAAQSGQPDQTPVHAGRTDPS